MTEVEALMAIAEALNEIDKSLTALFFVVIFHAAIS